MKGFSESGFSLLKARLAVMVDPLGLWPLGASVARLAVMVDPLGFPWGLFGPFGALPGLLGPSGTHLKAFWDPAFQSTLVDL